MKKALFIATLVALLLTACKKEFSTTPEGQSEASIPSTIENCTQSASFVEDVTIPDNTDLIPGKKFTKTWRIQNTGTCVWDETYSLAFALNNQMGAPDSVPLKKTKPGKEINISVDMTAPNINGTYRADFLLLDPEGNSFPIDNGQYLWVMITVGAP